MAKAFIDDTTLTNIGNAIRTKTGKSELLLPSEMPKEIESISGGGSPLPEPPIKPTLNDYTWDEVNQISALGATDETVWEKYNLHVGDSKDVTISGHVESYGNIGHRGHDFNGTYKVFIVEFNHNKEYEGTGISFCLGRDSNGVDRAYTKFSGGYPYWADSPSKKTSLGVYAILPVDLQRVIKLTKKYTYNPKNENKSETAELLFNLSEIEVQGVVTTGFADKEINQTQYEYYKNKEHWQKIDDGSKSDAPNLWVLRSLTNNDRAEENKGMGMRADLKSGPLYTLGGVAISPHFRV